MTHAKPKRSFLFAALLVVAAAAGYLSPSAKACYKAQGICSSGWQSVPSCVNGQVLTHSEADMYYSGWCGGVTQYACKNWRSVSCPGDGGDSSGGSGPVAGGDDGGGWGGGGGGGYYGS